MLVGVFWVVLLRDVVTEEDVGQSLEAVRVATWDVERDGVLVADVLGERLARFAIEHDDACRPFEAHEEIVLSALVVMEPPDHALPRVREVGLPGLLREQTLAPDLEEPAALVLDPAKRDPLEAGDHLFTPFCRTKSFTS